jgi:hypothetical protein
MANACVVEELPGSVEEAWALLEDFGDMSAWAPLARVRSVEGGHAVGSVRVVDTPDGVYRERCEAHDPEAHNFRYSLLESPANFDHYLGEVTLFPIDAGHCRIEWKCSFEIRGISDARMVEMTEDVYRDVFIHSLRESLEQPG